MKRFLPYFLTALLAGSFGWSMASRFHTASQVLATSPPHQCPMHPWVKADGPTKCNVCGMDLVVGSTTASSTNIVLLPQGSANVIGVQTSEVKKQPLVRTLRIAGLIGEDMSRHGVISAPVEGRIDGLSMNHEGQQVTRRQPLATIFSRTLLSTANDYNIALKQGPEAADLHKRKLEQYGLVWEQIKAIPQRQPDDLYFGILSPLTGVIVKSYISEGEYVKEGQKLLEIADFTRMWFMFNAYELDLPFLKIGQIVTLNAPHLPGQTLKGRIATINPNIDAMTRSTMVRVVLENPERSIKNNTFAEGTVDLEAPEVLALPRTAILWSRTSPRVYVEQASGEYVQREVKLGRTGDALWEIIEGVHQGEMVVTSGNMLIDSQAQLNAMAVPADPAAAVPLVAPEIGALTTYLKAVASVSIALANDDLTAAQTALNVLPNAPEGLIRTAVPTTANDIKALRQAFLPWSMEIASRAQQVRAQVPGLRVFCCPMTNNLWPGAPANGTWIQFSAELRNPYWGREMLDCGVEMKP